MKRYAPFLGLIPVALLFREDSTALVRVAALAIAATGVSIVSGMGGQLSLGHAALMGAGALTSAGLTVHVHAPLGIAMVAGVLMAAALGLVVGLPSLRLRGQYLALATLGAGVIVFRISNELSRFTGGELGLGGIPTIGGPLVTGFVSMGMLAAALAGTKLLHGSRLGLRLRAVRDDEAGAAACGVSILHAKLGAFVLSAAMAGAAGALFAHSEGFATTLDFDPAHSLTLIVAAVLGGMGSPLGGALGVLAIAGPSELAPGVFSWLDQYQLIVWGPLALYVVFAQPRGIAGIIKRRRRAEMPERGEIEIERGEGVVLKAEGITKRFGGLVALDGVSIDVNAGTIHALIGPNGSGKTTLIDCITGFTRADRGTVTVNGDEVTSDPPHRIARRGVARTFQNLAVFGSLTAIENVRVAGGTSPTGLDVQPVEASKLSYGQRKRLELARALAMKPMLLILDEPSAGRNEPEIRELATLLKELRIKGATILLVEHHMGLVQAVADEVTVLDEGRVIAHGTPAEIRADANVIEAYLGPAA